MAQEIERKFLVTDRNFIDSLTDGTRIVQAYLSTNPTATTRIRIYGDRAFLTVKSKNDGFSRHEWEYEIPVKDAEEMLEYCGLNERIIKTRHRIGRWEIDRFHDKLAGLVLAEIELENEQEPIILPDYLDKEVSNDSRYYNSNLLKINNLSQLK